MPGCRYSIVLLPSTSSIIFFILQFPTCNKTIIVFNIWSDEVRNINAFSCFSATGNNTFRSVLLFFYLNIQIDSDWKIYSLSLLTHIQRFLTPVNTCALSLATFTVNFAFTFILKIMVCRRKWPQEASRIARPLCVIKMWTMRNMYYWYSILNCDQRYVSMVVEK